jgi:heme exporter protein B
VFAAKALTTGLFVLAVEALVVPVAALLFQVDLTIEGPGLAAICLAATPGLAASGTLFGAMTVRTRARELVLATVLFPLQAPTLLAAVAATRELMGGAALGELTDYFLLMGVFDALFVAGGLAVFELLVEG